VNGDVRRYLPATIAALVIVALVMLAYIAGYHAGKSSVARTRTVVRP